MYVLSVVAADSADFPRCKVLPTGSCTCRSTAIAILVESRSSKAAAVYAAY